MKKEKFEEIELSILRKAVDEMQNKQGRRIINDPVVKELIGIVEEFIKKQKNICYGGTAINNILPEEDQFYNKDVEIPDYDFYSKNAMRDAKKLADIYFKKGYTEVEAKSGMHPGTFKVFVNFIPIADITQLVPEIFDKLYEKSFSVAGIRYASPNFLRMGMYLELSRPEGDVSRWEKVLKRLTLLNKNYPLVGLNCNSIEIQRSFYDDSNEEYTTLFDIIRNSFSDQGLVFFGATANKIYLSYLPKSEKRFFKRIPDFDVLSNDPNKSAIILKERLNYNGYNNVKIVKHKSIGEIVSEHCEILVNDETVAFIYKPLACHSYNKVQRGTYIYKIATIDTILSFYLAFLFSDREYYDENRILCLAQYLFKIQQVNRLSQKGALKRFSITCYGRQKTLEDIRSEKNKLFKKYKSKPNSKIYKEYFLKYNPQTKKKRRRTTKKTRKVL